MVDEEDLLLRIGTVPTVKTGKGGGSAGKERRAALPGMIGAGSGSGIGHAHASALKRDGDINQGAAWVDKVCRRCSETHANVTCPLNADTDIITLEWRPCAFRSSSRLSSEVRRPITERTEIQRPTTRTFRYVTLCTSLLVMPRPSVSLPSLASFALTNAHSCTPAPKLQAPKASPRAGETRTTKRAQRVVLSLCARRCHRLRPA